MAAMINLPLLLAAEPDVTNGVFEALGRGTQRFSNDPAS